MFTTDDHHLIGSMHVTAGKPCQDYALSGVYGTTAYAIVSDGCSSGGETDVGARLVSLAISSAIRKLTSMRIPFLAGDVHDEQKITLHQLRTLLPLTTEDLLATCVYVCLTPRGGFVSVRGDGAVAFKWTDGSITLYQFSWPNNTPFYPAYGLDGTKPFVDAHGGDLFARVLTEEVWSYDPAGVFSPQDTKHHSIQNGIQGIQLPVSVLHTLDSIAVFSDGVSCVEHVDWMEVVRELLAFKSVEGAFAKRRMIRFVQDARKIGKGPMDDIAYAVIRVTHDEQEGVAW